jgi:Uma2 family endonuclease
MNRPRGRTFVTWRRACSLPVGASPFTTTTARAGIEEVWIVNLPARTIEQHTDPSNEGYRRVDHKRGGQNLQPAALPGLTLTVDKILG